MQKQINTKEFLEERFLASPKEVRDLLELNTVETVVNRLGTNYNLTNKQQVLLVNEIILVLLIFYPKTGFAKRIQESLEIDQNFAEAIKDEVEEKIFNLVDNYLSIADRELTGVGNSDDTVSSIPSSASTDTSVRKETTVTPKISIQNTPEKQTKETESESQVAKVDKQVEQPVPEHQSKERDNTREGLRTMQTDAEQIRKYGGYRSGEAKSEKQSLADLPHYDEDEVETEDAEREAKDSKKNTNN